MSCIPFKVEVWSIAFAPDGKSIYVGLADGSLARYACATGRRIMAIPSGSGRGIISITAREGLVAFATSDRAPRDNIRVYDLAREKYILSDSASNRGGAALVVMSGDGKRVASMSTRGEVRIWNLNRVGKSQETRAGSGWKDK